MDQTILTNPVSEDSPCGADLQWDPDMLALDQAMVAALAEDESVVEGERVARDATNFEDVIRMAETLCARTKDLRVLTSLAEARWHGLGLAAFASTLEAIAVVVETWPEGREGVHPRADEDDGDLGERAAPLGKLLYRIPALAHTIGWGPSGEGTVDERQEVARNLRSVFLEWEERISPALGSSLPSITDAWQALRAFAQGGVEDAGAAAEEAAPGAAGAAAVAVRTADPWELLERAEELMRETAPHSPALPILGVLLRWRDMNIIDIMLAMRTSGITLEQLLESLRVQSEQAG